jgi:hypothetical protein
MHNCCLLGSPLHSPNSALAASQPVVSSVEWQNSLLPSRSHPAQFSPAADTIEKSKAAAAAAAAAALSGLRDVKPQQVTFAQLQEASRRKSRELARKPKPVVVDYSTAVAMAASPHLEWVPVATTPTQAPRTLSPVSAAQRQRCLESSWWRKDPHPNPAYVPPQRRSLDAKAQVRGPRTTNEYSPEWPTHDDDITTLDTRFQL